MITRATNSQQSSRSQSVCERESRTRSGSDRLRHSRPPVLKRFTQLLGAAIATTLVGCNSIITERYDATATVTYTWKVEYTTTPVASKDRRIETFASNTLVNHNGEKPPGAVTGPDDRGLWWPALPPRPTVDQIEAAAQVNEKPGTPELLKDVEYELTYQIGNRQVTKPTNYQVYREVAKAYPEGLPVKFTLGAGDLSVDRAEAQ